MIIYTLNDFWPDTQILQIITQQITKTDNDFAKTLDFKDINFPVKIRDIHKIENKNSFGISIFDHENK